MDDLLAGDRNRASVVARPPLSGGQRPSFPWGFEQLDQVACGILEQDLPAALTGDDVVAEVRPGAAQGLNLAGEVFDLELDPVPAARLGAPPVRHGLACAASSRRVQQQT